MCSHNTQKKNNVIFNILFLNGLFLYGGIYNLFISNNLLKTTYFEGERIPLWHPFTLFLLLYFGMFVYDFYLYKKNRSK